MIEYKFREGIEDEASMKLADAESKGTEIHAALPWPRCSISQTSSPTSLLLRTIGNILPALELVDVES